MAMERGRGWGSETALLTCKAPTASALQTNPWALRLRYPAEVQRSSGPYDHEYTGCTDSCQGVRASDFRTSLARLVTAWAGGAAGTLRASGHWPGRRTGTGYPAAPQHRQSAR